jgi:hypothetical protein
MAKGGNMGHWMHDHRHFEPHYVSDREYQKMKAARMREMRGSGGVQPPGEPPKAGYINPPKEKENENLILLLEEV